MREFTLSFANSFKNGLRPDKRVDRNTEYLSLADNVICREEGLLGAEDIYDPFEGDVAVNFPFPMLYRGEFLSLLLNNNSIGKVDETTFPWNVAYYNTDSFIPEGGVWHVMDLQNSFYLFNGSCIVAKINTETDLLVNTTIQPNSGIVYRGRPIIGGIRANEIWTEQWENIFYYWRERNEHLPAVITDKPDKSYVMWGTIGGGDFPLWLFKPTILKQGHVEYGTYEDIGTDSFMMNQLKMNQFGFMPMPFQGDVLCIKELGKGFMVYGEDGIVYMPQFDGRTVGNEQIPPTFGVRNVTSLGIAGRGAVGGTKDFHIFMDTSGTLWSIDAELSLKRLGYKEFLYDLLPNEIVISFDPQRTEFYITDGDTGYVLSKGLSNTLYKPTSLSYSKGELVGLLSNFDMENFNAFATTNTFDMGIRGLKTITNVNVGYTAPDDSIQTPSIGIYYRYDSTQPFKRSKTQVTNKEGVAYIRVQGIEFRLEVNFINYENVSLDYAHVRWQADDKRNVRGLGVIQDSA